MTISIIVAMGPGRVIGKNNKLPWHYPEDLKYFRHMTTGKIVIMGRKTYESIGRPLPNRRNIVLSRTGIDGIESYESIESLLEKLKSEQSESLQGELFVIGGSTLYQQFLEKDLVDTVYLTQVKKNYDGDAFFPEFESNFTEVERTSSEELDFVKYTRK